MNEYLTLQDVMALTTFSHATIYRLISKSDFPDSYHPTGVNRSVWLRSEVVAWMQSNLIKAA